MTKDINQLKKEARRAEKRADWDHAIQLYRRAISASEEAGDLAPDVSLYNRVGDLYRRRGDTERAVHYYLEAVDRYAEQDLQTGAIALCNKILRITPDRVEVYRKLGRLHAATGLVAEARNSYLEYASRMEDEGHPEARQEAFLELARITEDEELYLRTVQELEQDGRTDQAVEALGELWEIRRERGETADELRRRIVALDPSSDPVSAEEEPGGTEAAAPTEAAEASPTIDAPAKGDEPAGAAEPAEPGEPPTVDEPVGGGDPPSPDGTASDRAAVRLRYAEVLCRSGRDAEAVEQLEKLLTEIDPSEAPERAQRGLELLADVGGLDVGWRERALAWASEVSDPEVEAALRRLGGGTGGEGAAADAEPSDPAGPTSGSPPDGPPEADPAPAVDETRGAELEGEAPETVRDPGSEPPPADLPPGEEQGEDDAGLDDLMVDFRARAGETVGEADPDEHLELGQALRDTDRLDDAIREFQAAARAPEPPMRAFELLGAAFLEKGLASVAVRVLTRALRMPGYQDRDLLQVLYLLGLAREELGEPEGALDCYERVYSLDIDFRDVAERIRAVAR